MRTQKLFAKHRRRNDVSHTDAYARHYFTAKSLERVGITSSATARRCPVNACASASVASMSAHRRPRGTMTDAVPIGYRVERRSKQDFEDIAASLGISGAVLFEAMVGNTRSHLTTDGTPDWWTAPTKESPTDAL